MALLRLDSAVEISTYKEGTNDEAHSLIGQDNVYVAKSLTGQDMISAAACSTPSHSVDHKVSQSPPLSHSRSRLLSLPAELQLIIWELAVVQDEPLDINGACDSSFGGWTIEYQADVELWKNGTKKPPAQPPLTRVCRSIRIDALPMFYKLNRFQSGYCWETNLDMTLGWLRAIGEKNRELISLNFYDHNYMHDCNCPKDLKKLRRGPIIRELGGQMQSSYSDDACLHDVVFRKCADDENLSALACLFSEVKIK